MVSDGFQDSRAVARSEAARTDLPRDDPYLELMAVYVELGELLAGAPDGPGCEEELTALMDQLQAVAREQREYDEQRFAVWLSRITSGGVGVE